MTVATRVSRAGLVLLLVASGAFAGEQKIAAHDGTAFAQFGYSVAIDGNTAVAGALLAKVGDNDEQGSAYVFTRTNGGTWAEQAKLTARDGGARDEFGFSVAISGETIAVSSRKSDVGGRPDQGFVSIFGRTGNVWTEEAKLVASDGMEGDIFGHSVAIDGNTVVAGAPLVDFGPFASYGAAYVFVRNGKTWTQQARLQPANGFTADFYGLAVAVSGDTIVVGASSADIGINQNQGVAYVYVRHGNVWVEQAKLLAPDGVQFDEFARSVAIDGDTIVLGALANVDGKEYQGAAYVYVRQNGVWILQTRLTAADGETNDRFGFAVSLSGDRIAVGSYGHDARDVNDGAAYVFARQGTTWSQEKKLTASDGGLFSNFGYSIAISGDLVLAGVPSAGTNTGAAYAYDLNPEAGRRRAVRK